MNNQKTKQYNVTLTEEAYELLKDLTVTELESSMDTTDESDSEFYDLNADRARRTLKQLEAAVELKSYDEQSEIDKIVAEIDENFWDWMDDDDFDGQQILKVLIGLKRERHNFFQNQEDK